MTTTAATTSRTATRTDTTTETTERLEVVRLTELCGRVRPELACLGELATPLIEVLELVEQVGRDRDVSELADAGFALDVLAAAGSTGDAAVVGRVLEFLRSRANGTGAGPTKGAARMAVTSGRG